MKDIKSALIIHLPHRGLAVKTVSCLSLVLILSCSPVNIMPDGNINEQVKAENRIMKQNLTLAVRENSVLKDENFQYKNEISRLNTKVKLLQSETESLKKKQEQDLALLNEKYENLNKKNMQLEQESSAKILQLSSENRAIEEKLTGDIKKLNETIRKQEEKFNNDRAAAETVFSAKELDYQKELARLKKDIMNASVEMESIKLKLAESETNLQSARSGVLKRDDEILELKKKIGTLNSADEKRKEDSREIKKGNP